MKILITGTVCSGKTTLITEFEKMGHNVVHEKAREFIKEEQLTKNPILPWTHPLEFQVALLYKHLVHEEQLQKPQRPLFFDTGYLDSLTFLRTDGYTHTPEEYLHAAKKLSYDVLFLLEPLPYKTDEQRPQDEEYALKLHEMKKKVYETEFGLQLRTVPVLSVRERVAYILEKISTEMPK